MNPSLTFLSSNPLPVTSQTGTFKTLFLHLDPLKINLSTCA